MTKFTPILRKPGEVIRSEDWNKMQEDIQSEIQELENSFQKLKEYVNTMEESATMLNVDSLIGKAYNLDEVIPGETSSYEAPILGLLTKQWLLEKGKTGDICRLGLVSRLTLLEYWSGAENGNKKALEVTFNYIDGTNSVASDLYIHDRLKLRPRGTDNPYLEYLLSPNEQVWYRYPLINPNPEKEVLSVNFKNILAECTPRIGNVIHYRSKITPSKILRE
jgi:hypothetical protein